MARLVADKLHGCVGHAQFSAKDIARLEAVAAELKSEHEFDDANHAYIEAATRIAHDTEAAKASILSALKAQGDLLTAPPERAATPDTAHNFSDAFRALDARTREVVQRWLGVDENLDPLDEPETLDSIGRTLKRDRKSADGADAGVSRQAVHKMVSGFLTSVGLPEGMTPDAVRARFHLGDVDAERYTDTPTQPTGTGGVLSEESEAGAAARETDDDIGSESGPESGHDPSAEVDRAAQEQELQQLLDKEMKWGRITPEQIRDAAEDWGAMKMDSDTEWGDLDAVDQAAWVRHFAHTDGHTTAEVQGKILEQHQDRVSQRREASTAEHEPTAPTATAEGVGRSSAVAPETPVHAGDSGTAGQVQPARQGRTDVARDGVAPKVSTPVEMWTALQARTPGMLTWEDLTSRQQGQWADLTRRGVANLAAAQQIAGGSVADSEGRGPLGSTPSETTSSYKLQRSTLEDVQARPGMSNGFARLETLGIPHVSDWVSDWYTGPENTYHVAGSRQVVQVRPMEPGHGANTTAVNLVHEIGHAVDMANFGGVYSSHPDLAFSGSGADIHPTGVIASEVGEARQWHPEFFEEFMAYPYSQEEWGHLITTPTRASQELFAQLFGMMAHPKLEKFLADNTPQAYAFIKAVIEDVKGTKPQQIHNQNTAGRRAAAFRAAFPGGSAGQGGSVGVPGSPVGQGGRGGALHAAQSAHLNAALEALASEQTTAGRITKAMPEAARTAFTNLRDQFKRISPWLLTNLQIVKEFGDKIKSLRVFAGLGDLMRQDRTRMQMEFNAVAVAWDKLPANIKDRLNALMQKATMQEMHPDLAFDHEDNAHLKRADPAENAEMQKKHAALRAEYTRLAAASPAAIKVYQDAKNLLEKSWEERAEAYKKVVDDTYSESIAEALNAGNAERVETLRKQGVEAEREYAKQLSSIKGPYFPLMRFGDYLAIGESDAYKAAADTVTAATGEGRKKAQAALDELKRDPNHYQVSAHEDRAAAEAAAKQYEAAGLTPRTGMGALRVDNVRPVTQTTVTHLVDAVRNKLGEDSGPVRDALMDVFLRGLPEMHALRREAERKGVAGADMDMLRAFSAAGRSNAFYASRLLHAKAMADTMFEMRREVKGNIDLEHVYREMQKRVALDMKYTATPIQDTLASLSWVYHLGVSPSFVMMNATQPWLVSVPALAGRFGVAKATSAMGAATRDAMAVLRDARWKDGKWDWWSGISEDSIPGPSRNEDRAAIRVLLRRGIVDEGIQHELNMYAQDSSRWLSKVQRGMGWATQQVEVVNRLATALAAFRLAREGGMGEVEATDYAYDVTHTTQLDYSSDTTARFMREGGGVPLAKLVFQFRRYQQGLLYLFGHNIKKAFGSGADAVQARSTLAYLAAATGAAAGAAGLPFMAVGMFIANLMIPDDDEEGDAETRMRNFLVHMTGDKDTADVLAKGLPALWGWDLSNRLGLEDIASPLPMARYNNAKTGDGVVGETLRNIAGPVAGTAASLVDAAGFFGQGDWAKGAEKLLPKMMSDIIKAGRYAESGMTDYKGEQILGPDELSAWNLFSRTLGVASTKESNYYEGTRALKNLEKAVSDRRSNIAHKYAAYVSTGVGDASELRDMIEEFNADHPQASIKPKDEVRWRKDALRARSERDESGIRYNPKKDQAYQEVMRFAR